MTRQPKGIIVAIDGPAASGKSTTARAVAERLGYSHLNSGLLYRAITWIALRDGWLAEHAGFDDRVSALDLVLQPEPPTFGVLVSGFPVGPELYAPETSAQVSAVAARSRVREKVLALLRETPGTGIVCDGRDIGTVVFPEAQLKIFLVASVEERGRRRMLELGREPTATDLRVEVERLAGRDRADSARAEAPLRKSADAVEIDSTDLSPSQVVKRIVELVEERVGTG